MANDEITKDGWGKENIVNNILFSIEASEVNEGTVFVKGHYLPSLENEDLRKYFYKKSDADMEAFKINKIRMGGSPPRAPRDVTAEVTAANKYLAEAMENLVGGQFVVWAMEYVRRFPNLSNPEILKTTFDAWTCKIDGDENS